jgi:hypothetical protein
MGENWNRNGRDAAYIVKGLEQKKIAPDFKSFIANLQESRLAPALQKNKSQTKF